jgi:hypothetical protein
MTLLERAVEILKALESEDICMTDHHGDCQEHYGEVEIRPAVDP